MVGMVLVYLGVANPSGCWMTLISGIVHAAQAFKGVRPDRPDNLTTQSTLKKKQPLGLLF
jgi:hypothetical protein